MMNITYDSKIEEMILMNLDGWRIDDNSTTEENINPFMTADEASEKANKLITSTECQIYFEEALDLAYIHTNRLNIDDLTSIEQNMFIRGVCKWAASNLWNKYNIRVNNEDLEDTYIQSYGGLLYHNALKILNPFINQHITGFTNNDEDNKSNWIM